MMQRLRASGNIPDKFLRPINSCCWFTSTSLFSASPGSPEGRLKQSKEPLQGLCQTNAPQPPSEQPKKTKIIRPAPRVKSRTKHEMRVKADGWASGGWDSIYSTDSVILLCAYMDIPSSHRLYFMKSVFLSQLKGAGSWGRGVHRKKKRQMYARTVERHSPLTQEANTLKDALVGPEVVMNIHMHMYTRNTTMHFTIKVCLRGFKADFILIWQQMWTQLNAAGRAPNIGGSIAAARQLVQMSQPRLEGLTGSMVQVSVDNRSSTVGSPHVPSAATERLTSVVLSSTILGSPWREKNRKCGVRHEERVSK